MPVMACISKGSRGWKWGKSGHCYIEKNAKQKAIKQGQAILASQGRLDQKENILQQASKSRKKFINRKRPPKWLYPLPVEFEYRRCLKDINVVLKQSINEIIIKHLPNLVEEADVNRPVKVDAWPDSVDRLVDNLRIEVKGNITGQKSKLIDIGDKTSTFNNREWRKIVDSVLGVPFFQSEPWLNDTVNSFADENVALISDLTEKTYRDIEGIVQRGIRSGKRHETIRGEIRGTKLKKGVFQKLDSRVNLIARDQISKLNGQLAELRQTDLGIEEYFWRTVRDRRVRDAHSIKEGKRYRWSKPPSDTGHPGEDYQCRCYAEAVFDDIIDEMVELKAPTKFIKREPDEISTLLTGAKSKTEMLQLVRKYRAFKFINLESFKKTSRVSKTLQLGLLRTRLGNLLRTAIKRSGLKVIPPVKKIIPVKKFKAKVAAYETQVSEKFMGEVTTRKVEYGGIFDSRTGKKLWSGTSHKKYSVSIPEKHVKNNYVIHSHPIDRSFSFNDIVATSVNEEAAADAVSQYHVYKMRNIKQYKVKTKTGKFRNANSIEFFDKYHEMHEEMWEKIAEKYTILARNNKITIEAANVAIQHEVIKEFAKKTKLFTYERIVRKGAPAIKPITKVVKPITKIAEPSKRALKKIQQALEEEWYWIEQYPNVYKGTIEEFANLSAGARGKLVEKAMDLAWK